MRKKPKPAARLTAAECARRTRLTVRALRVYERAGLLRPARSAKGWRLYGAEDLLRLNTIIALKNFGLSLAQIRAAFGKSAPDLAQVLDLQLKVWASRKLAADQAIGQIHFALARLRSHARLTLDELCELLRNSDMTDMQTLTRELINQHITPEQEREWLGYWAQRPTEAAASRELQAGARAITQEFLACMRQGLPADAAKVRLLVERSQENWLKGGMRERQLEQFEWNPEVSRAWFALGAKLMARSVVPDDADEAERLRLYILAARRAAPAAVAFRPLVTEAARLLANAESPTGAEARKLARRYAELCREHDLGDASVHARWIAAIVDCDTETRRNFEFLARIVSG
jgi:DNA-binding transcriptional MerR regulator